MPGRLILGTPWVRQAMSRESRLDVIAAIPDGYTLDVTMTGDRRMFVFRLKGPDGHHGPLRVSASMSPTSASLYALRHFGFGRDTTVTIDPSGYIKEITDAG